MNLLEWLVIFLIVGPLMMSEREKKIFTTVLIVFASILMFGSLFYE